MGDYLRPSAFVRAARLEEEAAPQVPATAVDKDIVIGDADSDNDEWVSNFERRYLDVTRVAQKAKHAEKDSPFPCKSAAAKKSQRKGTPARVEPCVLAPLEVVYPAGAELRAAEAEQQQAPRYVKMKVALDSGAGTHVINMEDAPGYEVKPSVMSQSGAAFLAADGGRIRNHGEVHVNMLTHDSKGQAHKVTSRFEAADVTRALWSVGLICDSGLDVRFTSERALVLDKHGKEVCMFARSNGLYVAEVEVEIPSPEDFHRQGR